MNETWRMRHLDEVCAFENGDRGTNYPSRAHRTSSGVPFINAGHLVDGGIDFENMDYISRERFDLLRSGKVRSGDLLFCLRGSLGKAAPVGKLTEGAIASSLVIVRPNDSVSAEYLLAFFNSDICARMIEKFRNGAAQPNLSAGSLGKFSIPVPDRREQERIVSILDEAFEGIAAAKANAEKCLELAMEVFRSEHDKAFNSGADVTELGAVASFRNGINFTKNSRGATVRVVGVKDFKNNYWVPDTGLDCVTLDGALDKQDRLVPGDLLVVRSNGNPELIGRCMEVGNLSALTTHSGFTIRVRITSPAFLPAFVCQFMRSVTVRKQLVEGGNGTSIRSLNQGGLAAVRLPVIGLAEQRTVVARINRLVDLSEAMAGIYRSKLAALDELKKSLLHKAFAGEL